jgi:dihydrolipoamide dehydrogenase
MLAHVAEEEGAVAARNALREHALSSGEALPSALAKSPDLETVDYSCVPACVYTFPEIAMIGLSRDAAGKAGIDAVQAVSKYAGNGKALGEGESGGFVQMIAERGTGRVVGCQIVGPHAVETIHEVAIAKRHGLSVRDVADTVHAHPTVSEVIKLAALDAAEKCGV